MGGKHSDYQPRRLAAVNSTSLKLTEFYLPRSRREAKGAEKIKNPRVIKGVGVVGRRRGEPHTGTYIHIYAHKKPPKSILRTPLQKIFLVVKNMEKHIGTK